MSKKPTRSRSRTCPIARASALPCSTATASSGSAGGRTRTPRARARGTGGRCRRAASTRARIPTRRRSANSMRRPRSERTSLIEEAEGWLTYDLPLDLIPTSWNGRYRGQKQKWFALRFEGDESEIDVLHPGGGKHQSRVQRLALGEARAPARADRPVQARRLRAGGRRLPAHRGVASAGYSRQVWRHPDGLYRATSLEASCPRAARQNRKVSSISTRRR